MTVGFVVSRPRLDDSRTIADLFGVVVEVRLLAYVVVGGSGGGGGGGGSRWQLCWKKSEVLITSMGFPLQSTSFHTNGYHANLHRVVGRSAQANTAYLCCWCWLWWYRLATWWKAAERCW